MVSKRSIAEEFVVAIHRELVVEGRRHYASMLALPVGEMRDPRVRLIFEALSGLSASEKEAVATLVGVALRDTLAGVFAIVDGSSVLESCPERFVLTYGPGDEVVNGELLDMLGDVE